MLPAEILNILEKYKEINKTEIECINRDFQDVINQLKQVRCHLSKELSKYLNSDEIDDDKEDNIHHDIKILKKYIKSISEISISVDNICEISEELTPVFNNKVYSYLIDDDLCPFCNVKLIPHWIHYQRIINNVINNESVKWYRCPNCNKLFAVDYEFTNFDLNDTNIELNKSLYNDIPSVGLYSVVVLCNTLKCSSSHKTTDFIAKLPTITPDGELKYINANASYCFSCKRFTILKEDFNKIENVILCKIIDESSDTKNDSTKDEIEIAQRRSVLFNYGYNTQTKKNLSSKQRHTILASVIEGKILGKREIIDHINTLIERGSKIPSWKAATTKWKEDKEFVSNYQNDYLPEIIVDQLLLRYKSSK